MFNQKTKLFTLYKNVQIISGNFVLISQKINFNLVFNAVYNNYLVKFIFQNSTTKASSFSIYNSNIIITFEGGVTSTFELDDS